MSRVAFEVLPASARLWAFAATRELNEREEQRLLEEVDSFLDRWQAHGSPLTCARDWRGRRFLAVAVDQRDAHASGCSIDGMYRVLRGLQTELGVGLLGGGLVFYRTKEGDISVCTRAEFEVLAERGEVTPGTRVFDLTVSTVGDWQHALEKRASESWHGQLLTSGKA